MRNASLTAVVPQLAPLAAVAQIDEAIAWRAGAIDAAACFPEADLAALAAAGLLSAPLPTSCGGQGLADRVKVVALADVLTRIGRASLTVGRLYEGHVNAVLLVRLYGDHGTMTILADEVAAGRSSGVWNAQRGVELSARREPGGWRLSGRKIYCSGAGAVVRPLVTAVPKGETAPLMMLPEVTSARVDLSAWRPSGMRGTATGTVSFDDLFVPDAAVVGRVGDYYRSPHFSGGAWRVLAVQLGGLEQLLTLHAEHLLATGRDLDPLCRARFGQAAVAFEHGRLAVREAARRASDSDAEPDAIDAYVDLIRGSFETLAMDSIAVTRRNCGLIGQLAPHPLDRVIRDLETYLRQPLLDASRDHAAGWLLGRGGHFG